MRSGQFVLVIMGSAAQFGVMDVDQVDDGCIPVSRIRPLVDGIYAIIITLLLLDLRAPTHVGHGQLLDALWAMRWSFCAVGFAFLYLVGGWLAAHEMFRRLQRVRPAHVFLLVAPVGAMALIPLASRTVANSVHDSANLAVAVQLLAGVIALHNALVIVRHLTFHRAGLTTIEGSVPGVVVKWTLRWVLLYVAFGAVAYVQPWVAIALIVVDTVGLVVVDGDLVRAVRLLRERLVPRRATA